MPIRILEEEKEGHRKVKTDFRKKRLKKFKEKITGKNLQNFDVTMIELKEEGPAKKHKSFDVSKPYESTKKKKGGRTGKQFGGPLARRPLPQSGVAPTRPLPQSGVAPTRPLPQSGVAPTRPLGFKSGGRTGFKHGGSTPIATKGFGAEIK